MGPRPRNRFPQGQGSVAGFLLVETLISLAVGLLLLALIARITLQDSGQARTMGRWLRERLVAQRALELIRSELQEALQVSLALPPSGHAGCSLAGRPVKLHLVTAAGPVTYALENRPEAIWRGRALIRCGPAYGLDGQLNPGPPVSRVLLDALAEDGLAVRPDGLGLQLELIRHFGEPMAEPQVVALSLSSVAPGLAP